MGMDDRVRILEQETRRPQRVGEVRALGFELRREPAVQDDDAVAGQERRERIDRHRRTVSPLAHRCLPHVVRLRPSVAGV